MSHNQIVRSVGHLGNKTPESEFYALTTLMYGISSAAVTEVDALIVWPGIVLEAAAKHAIRLWNMGIGKYLLIAGYHESDIAEEYFNIDNLTKKFNITRKTGLVRSQVYAAHSAIQAAWVATQVQELGVSSVALCTPQFHLLRAYLTTLEALRRLGIKIPIIPIWPLMSPFEVCVLNQAPGGKRDKTVLDVIHAEVNPRMISYQRPKEDGSPGDVATYAVFIEYLRWLYEQPIILEHLL